LKIEERVHTRGRLKQVTMAGLVPAIAVFDRHCERSEAIQCSTAVLDCFVASLLAMTAC
jgi:hypothetical protein